MTLPGHGAYDLNGKPIPPAFRRVSIPRGSTIRIRAKAADTPTSLIVEAPDGTDLLTLTVTPDNQLDMKYDPARMTEAGRRLLVEVRQLLGLSTQPPHIQIATDPTPRPPQP